MIMLPDTLKWEATPSTVDHFESPKILRPFPSLASDLDSLFLLLLETCFLVHHLKHVTLPDLDVTPL